jgi:hypothetical protein
VCVCVCVCVQEELAMYMNTDASGLASELQRLKAWREAYEQSNAVQWRQLKEEHAAEVKRMRAEAAAREEMHEEQLRKLMEGMNDLMLRSHDPRTPFSPIASGARLTGVVPSGRGKSAETGNSAEGGQDAAAASAKPRMTPAQFWQRYLAGASPARDSKPSTRTAAARAALTRMRDRVAESFSMCWGKFKLRS